MTMVCDGSLPWWTNATTARCRCTLKRKCQWRRFTPRVIWSSRSAAPSVDCRKCNCSGLPKFDRDLIGSSEDESAPVAPFADHGLSERLGQSPTGQGLASVEPAGTDGTAGQLFPDDPRHPQPYPYL